MQSLTLVEPACLSLTAELPATAAHRALMQPLFEVRHNLSDEDFHREFVRRVFAAHTPAQATLGAPRPEDQREARRLRLQAPPWEAPLQIVPGVPPWS